MAVARRIPIGSGSVFDDEFGVGSGPVPGGDSIYAPPNGNTGVSGYIPGGLPVPPIEEEDPQLPDVIQGERGGETPRERAASGSGGGGTGSPGITGSLATPPRPKVPTPMAGVASTPPQGPSVNAPLPPIVSQARQRSLLGGMGGLTMGGLGVPFDPTSNQKSDPISSLMALLKGRF